MANNYTTTGTLPPMVRQKAMDKILLVERPNLIYKTTADIKIMPKNSGDTAIFRSLNKFSPVPVPLGNDSDDINGQVMSANDIPVKMEFYGTYTTIDEQVPLQNESPVFNDALMLLGICLRETEDLILKNMLASTAVAINCSYGLNGDTPTEFSPKDIRVLISTLAGNNAQSIAESIELSEKYGSAPIPNAFFMYTHTDLIPDLESMDGFKPVILYAQQNRNLSSEWGAFSNIRFLVSSQASVTKNYSSLSNDVYNNIVSGYQGYAAIEQQGYHSQLVYRPPIYSGPMANRATIAFKTAIAGAILNSKWVINFCSTKG